jgi:hypothetical protein
MKFSFFRVSRRVILNRWRNSIYIMSTAQEVNDEVSAIIHSIKCLIDRDYGVREPSNDQAFFPLRNSHTINDTHTIEELATLHEAHNKSQTNTIKAIRDAILIVRRLRTYISREQKAKWRYVKVKDKFMNVASPTTD